MTQTKPKHTGSLKLRILFAALTALGLGLFVYFIYEAGILEIWLDIKQLGYGFLIVLALYAVKLSMRVLAWTWCVEAPYKLPFLNAFRAVMMGEALSSMLPLGILVSGTSKAVAVRKQVPFVVGLSSVAIENIFYSLATALFILGGGASFLFLFNPSGNIAAANYALIVLIVIFIVAGFFAIVQEWRFASQLSNWLYNRNFLVKILRDGRREIARFEDLLFGFYRRNRRKFLPLLMLQFIFHAIGVLEVWIILRAISETAPNFLSAFLLESVNRVILIVFKLVPFVLGVDEAAAQYITETLAIGASVGVTLAIVRKGRVLFWTFLGVLLIARSGLSFRDITTDTGNQIAAPRVL